MGNGYTRQSETDIQATNVVKAKSFNDEFDELLAAFVASTGHTHDGTAAEGGPIIAMRDADGDTKIQVEESADEDKIRFDIAGTEEVGTEGSFFKNFTGNFVWVRTVATYTSGTIQSVLLNH